MSADGVHRDAGHRPRITGSIQHEQRQAVRDADEDADILEEPLLARQRGRLHEEVLERDRKDDQRGAAGAGEDPFKQCVWGLRDQVCKNYTSPADERNEHSGFPPVVAVTRRRADSPATRALREPRP